MLMEAFKGESAHDQRTVSMRKRAGPESTDATTKRQRKEQTSAQDVSSRGNPVHRKRQTLKPSLLTLPGGFVQASNVESPGMEIHVGEAAVGERPHENQEKQQRMTRICEHQCPRMICKECKGSGICEHQRRRYRCKECRDVASARAS
jgi:hypothetical protein